MRAEMVALMPNDRVRCIKGYGGGGCVLEEGVPCACSPSMFLSPREVESLVAVLSERGQS